MPYFFSFLFIYLFIFFFYQSETTIAKQFLLNVHHCFLFIVLYCLETCVNCVANCVTQKFTPLRYEFCKSFFQCHFMDNLCNYSTYLSPYYQNSFFLNLDFSFLFEAPWCLKTSVNCVTNWTTPKIYPNSLGHDKINLDLH